MKTFLICCVVALTLLSLTKPVQAQGTPFGGGPVDHWVYAAVIDLESKGILIGYPDGRFYGERALTRYEFAIAMKRVLDSLASKHGMILAANSERSDRMVSFLGDFFTGISSNPSGFAFVDYDGAEIGATNLLFPQFLMPGDFNPNWQANLFGTFDLRNNLTTFSYLLPQFPSP